jgi:hypothetical protein
MGNTARSGYALLTLIAALGGLLAAPAAAESTACASDHDITIQQLLLNTRAGFSPGDATISLAAPIPAGDYELTMVSYDEHSSKLIDQSDQIHEQWFLQLLDTQGAVVFESDISPDLPDDQDWLTFTTGGRITGEAVTMRVVHAELDTNVNSIIAHCAGFTLIPPALGSIGDTVWFDADGNGVQDAGEGGIPGVTVTLAGPAAATATTDGNGLYGFADLPAGEYTVIVGAGPLGTALSTPGSDAVTLAEGQDYVDADFGFAPIIVEPELGAIGDAVWLDQNGNGWMDGAEAGIAGVRVVVTSAAGTLATVTDAKGRYLFPDLVAGDYDVTVDLATAPAGTALTTAEIRTVALAAGETFLDADFGLAAPVVKATGMIGDLVWLDDNLNGTMDPGETPLAGVTVSLFDPATGTTQTAVTNASGRYLFVTLKAGSYEVSVMTSTAPESTALTTTGMYALTLADGQTSLIADFGFAQALPTTGFETADFGIAGLVLLLIGMAVLVLVRPAGRTPWHLVDAYEVS